MTAFSAIFLVGLVAVIALQVAHRLAGSLCAVVWCLGVLVWGTQLFDEGLRLHFFGIRSDKRVFAGLMIGFAAYNAYLVVKELRRRRTH